MVRPHQLFPTHSQFHVGGQLALDHCLTGGWSHMGSCRGWGHCSVQTPVAPPQHANLAKTPLFLLVSVKLRLPERETPQAT